MNELLIGLFVLTGAAVWCGTLATALVLGCVSVWASLEGRRVEKIKREWARREDERLARWRAKRKDRELGVDALLHIAAADDLIRSMGGVVKAKR